jgi:hypothetical protein
MNRTFAISEAELARRRRAPALAGLIWGGLAIAFAFMRIESFAFALPLILAAAAFMTFVAWRTNRDFLLWARTHRLVVLDEFLLIVDGTAEGRLPYSGIQRVVINKRLGKVKNVVLIRDNGTRDRLPPYENLAELVELLRQRLGSHSMEERHFVHV